MRSNDEVDICRASRYVWAKIVSGAHLDPASAGKLTPTMFRDLAASATPSILSHYINLDNARRIARRYSSTSAEREYTVMHLIDGLTRVGDTTSMSPRALVDAMGPGVMYQDLSRFVSGRDDAIDLIRMVRC